MNRIRVLLLFALLLLWPMRSGGLEPAMQLMDYPNPVLTQPDPNLSFLKMDNNVTDEIGNYTWTNQSVVSFSAVIVKNGTHSAYFDYADVDELIYSDTAISETVKAAAFYLYIPAGHTTNVTYAYWAETSDLTYGIRVWTGKGLYQYVSGGWSAMYTLPSYDTWYHIGVNFDGSDVKVYVDDIERISTSSGTQPTNKTHYWGGYAGATGFVLGGYLDDCKLYTATQDSFP